MRISDWSSDGCSSDLAEAAGRGAGGSRRGLPRGGEGAGTAGRNAGTAHALSGTDSRGGTRRAGRRRRQPAALSRSEEHTSELQSLMRISYAVFCLKKKKTHEHYT